MAHIWNQAKEKRIVVEWNNGGSQLVMKVRPCLFS